MDDPLDEQTAQEAGYKSKTILHSKYKQVKPKQVALQQTHLSSEQQADLVQLFSKYQKLFSGKLGKYPNRKVHLELNNTAIPTVIHIWCQDTMSKSLKTNSNAFAKKVSYPNVEPQNGSHLPSSSQKRMVVCIGSLISVPSTN